MSEAIDAAPVHEGPSAGTLLRRAREAAGLHVAALAVSLKVPVRKLEALEQDRIDLLPDAVFARALASSVCRTLKIDAQPVLERLPQSVMPRLGQDRDSINAPFRAPGDVAGPTWVHRMTRPVPLAVGGLLLAALIVFLLPYLPAVPTPERAAVEPVAAVPEVSVPVVIPADSPATAVEGTAPGSAVSDASGTSVQATASTPSAPTESVAASMPSAAPTADATGLVVFRASGPSWIQVTDARGVVTLRRLLSAGESVGASGALPLAVTVGSASATQVEVRGKPMDLGPLARDNVARFEVK